MSYIPISPFRRPIDAALLKHQGYLVTKIPVEGVNKWDILRDVATARHQFNLSDRGVSVLEALLSFHPEKMLRSDERGLVVYPSNAAICDRLNGMACSTMRRHLATLIAAGLILRRDSPNGKRFVKRYKGDTHTFGFDLTPLATRHEEINATADAAKSERERLQQLRRTVSLMRRDLSSLVLYGKHHHPECGSWDALSDTAALAAQRLRRKANLTDLTAIQDELGTALKTACDVIDAVNTTVLSTNELQNEQHHQNSSKEIRIDKSSVKKSPEVVEEDIKTPNLPLPMVLAACSEIANYVPDRILNWRQLVNAAEFVHPMMGISKTVWMEAVKTMGVIEASVVIAAMLQRFEHIRSSGGYLRYLTQKYQQGEFSSGRMISALMPEGTA